VRFDFETAAAITRALYDDPAYQATEACDLLAYIADPGHGRLHAIPASMARDAARLLGDMRTAGPGGCDPVDAVAGLLAPVMAADLAWARALLTGFAAQHTARTNRMMVLIAAAVHGPFASPSPAILTAIGARPRHRA
jgi:hypothetical protein